MDTTADDLFCSFQKEIQKAKLPKGWDVARNAIEIIEERVREQMDYFAAHLRSDDGGFWYFNRHDNRHIKRVIGFIYDVIQNGSISLSSVEKFIIYLAAYGHDLGMTPWNLNLKEAYEKALGRPINIKATREKHMVASGYILEDILRDYIRVKRKFSLVSEIASYHEGDVDLNGGKEVDGVRRNLLIALLRIGDRLDAGEERLPLSDIMAQCLALASTHPDPFAHQLEHYMRRYLVAGVKCKKAERRITIEIERAFENWQLESPVIAKGKKRISSGRKAFVGVLQEFARELGLPANFDQLTRDFPDLNFNEVEKKAKDQIANKLLNQYGLEFSWEIKPRRGHREKLFAPRWIGDATGHRARFDEEPDPIEKELDQRRGVQVSPVFEIRRRDLMKVALVSGVLILSGILQKALSLRRTKMFGSKKYMSDAVLKIQYSARYGKLMDSFHKADSFRLMRHYALGFTPLLIAGNASDADQRRRVLADIDGFAGIRYDQVETDRHRIKAFPACAAAHLMPLMRDHDHIFAGELICELLQEPQRELQEIIFQNLICSLTRDQYSWTNFWLPDQVIHTTISYLSKRYDNPLLNPGSNLAIQLLVYYSAALQTRKVLKPEREPVMRQRGLINKAISEIESSKGEYAWFVRSWLKAIQNCCGSLLRRGETQLYMYLPPQSSELVMGWRSIYRDWLSVDKPRHPWFPVLAGAVLNNALCFHLNREIIEGGASSKLLQRDYGESEARNACRKLELWFKNIALHRKIFLEAINQAEGPLVKTLRQLAEETATIHEPSAEQDPDWSLIPFRYYYDTHPVYYRVELLENSILGDKSDKAIQLLGDWATDFWSSKIRLRTPKTIEEAIRPTNSELIERMNRRDFLQILHRFKRYMEGDPEAFLD